MRELNNNPTVIRAAQWLADQQEPPPQAVPTLKADFGLSALQACEACKLAQSFRLNRKVYG
ncbi:hypothetical protein FLX27_15285 [Agrobacterium tumefaciens]|nr:hypothetical protein FLX27_15285 [Agrobacterium tumefaciens]